MRLIRRLAYLFRQRRRARELAEEIDLHRQLVEDQQRAAGLSADDAHYAARRLIGNATLTREDASHVWVAAWIGSVFQDLHYATRSLRNQPGFTALALLALVLGIGLNTSLFTVFNAVALRPWPVRDPGRMVTLNTFVKPLNGYFGFAVAEYRYLAQHSRTLQGAYLERAYQVSLDQQPDGPRSRANFVTGNYFSLLGVEMARGRGFTPEEDRAEAPQAAAVLSYAAWQTRYGRDPAILGRQIRLDDVLLTVVGVAREDFTGTSLARNDVWVPLAALPLVKAQDATVKTVLSDPHWCCSNVAARLAPGVTRDQARAELSALGSQFTAQMGEAPQEINVVPATIFSPNERRRALPTLTLLMAAVGAILLLACANVSNLLLARAAARQREIAVRVAIGAGRFRIIRQLLTESLLLAAAAGGLGLLVAYVLPGIVLRQVTQVASWDRFIQPDTTVLAYSMALATLSAVLFGLAPALRGTSIGVSDAMKQQSPHTSPRFSLRGVLLGVQVAISTALLVGGALLIRGLITAQSLDPGFKIDQVSAVTVDLPANSYGEARARAFFDELTAQVEAAAGGLPVGIAAIPPLSSGRNSTGFNLPGQDAESSIIVLTQSVNAGYFDLLGIPIVAGRNFIPEDRDRRKVLINETMARRYWPGKNAVGQAVLSGRARREIVGVVRDSKIYGLGPVEPVYFEPFTGGQHPYGGHAVLLVPGAMAAAARDLARNAEARAAVSAAPLADELDRWLGNTRAGAALASALGLLALLLATIGVYGVIAYSVEQRRREIGVRMALGARPGEIVRLILNKNARAVVCGLAVGLAASVAGSKALESWLYGVSRLDPFAYGGVLLLLLAAGIAASVVPAHSAARTDPLRALRHE